MEVTYKGEKWFYSENMHWLVENDNLSNHGIWRQKDNSQLVEIKRLGVSFEINEITAWKN